MTRDAVIKTLAYFDLFEYPLTTFEVWKWLWGEAASLERVAATLAHLAQEKKIETAGGYWFLTGRLDIVETRHERHRLSIAKFHRARRFTRLFSLVPWVEGVAVCNSVGYRNASAASDIDFFIITKPGAVWVTRALTALMVAALGQRPSAAHTANTACLSFYVSRSAMGLAPLLLTGGDPYFAYWTTALTPLFGRGNVWQAFWEANAWVTQVLPNAIPYQSESPYVYQRGRAQSVGLPVAVERWARRLQERRFPVALREQAGRRDSHVIVNDRMLKFHMNDRRALYRQRWEELYVTLV